MNKRKYVRRVVPINKISAKMHSAVIDTVLNVLIVNKVKGKKRIMSQVVGDLNSMLV